MSQTIALPSLERETVQLALRQNLGHACYVSSVSSDRKSPMVQVGVVRSDLVHHGRTDESIALFAKLPDVYALQATKAPKGFKLTIPDDLDPILTSKRYNLLLESHERGLLSETYRDLVKIDEVSLAMRPIKRILVDATEFGGYIPGRRRGRKRVDDREPKYLSFLEQLGFIKLEGGRYVQGPGLEIAVAPDTPGPMVYETFLGMVLQRGSAYLTSVLNLAMIVPFLRVENAYYWPAHLAHTKLEFTRDGLRSAYRSFYGARRDRIMFDDKVQSLTETGVLEIDNGMVSGADRILGPLMGRPVGW